MKIKENIHIFVIASVLFLVLYTLLAVRPLSRELQLTPEWTTSIIQTPENWAATGEAPLPFRLGQNMGYFTRDGQIALMETFSFQAAISNTYRAAYSPDSMRIPVYQANSPATDGEPDFYLEGAGFPFFSNDRMYLLSPGGYGISQHTKDDGQIWQFEHSAPIITVASSPAGTAVGYADGVVFIFSPAGELLQTFEPGGSTYPIILGTALSDSGNQFACVSGIDQQRFVLTQQRNGVNKVVFHTYLEGNQREPVLVQFSADESRAFYACRDGIGIVDCDNFDNTVIPLNGKILSIQECPTNNLICVLTKDSGNYTVYLIEDEETLVGSFGFGADAAFITAKEGYLYIGRDAQISKIDLERE